MRQKTSNQASIAAPGQTPLEYAREHNLTLDWIYQLARTGRLPHVKVFGRLFITGSRTGGRRRAKDATISGG